MVVPTILPSRVEEAPHARESPVAPDRTSHVTSQDPRIPSIDRRIADNDWQGIAKELGSLADAGKLPSNLGLLAALAHHEAAEGGSQEAVAVAVRCVAAILRVPEDGAIAGVIGRRLLRKHPVRFSQRKAPPPRVSVLIMLTTLVLGGLVGWLMSGGLGALRAMLRPP